MALNRLRSLVASTGASPQREALCRWTETPENQPWDSEPEYGAFVDDSGKVVTGSVPARAFLEDADPTQMELAPQTARALTNATVVFLDWGRQSLTWEEIFELWTAWESQEMVADCGAVSVPWSLSQRWIAPGWVAFRGDFDGSPLSTIVRKTPEPLSFLAKARQLRALEAEAAPPEGPLPLLPFTLDDLKDPGRTWPQGTV